jgi:hypothetical protein
MGVWLALLFAVNPGLWIGSATDCPSAVQVLEQIAPLLPAGMTAAETSGTPAGNDADRGEVTIDQGDRWVRLRGHDQRINHERALPRSLSCAEAARTAAVLLAAWEFQGRAGTDALDAGVPLNAPPTSPPGSADHPKETVVEIVRGEAVLNKIDAPPAADKAPPAGVANAPIAPAPAAPRAPVPRRLGLGGGVSMAAHVDRLVATAAAEIIFGPATGIGFRLEAATTSRDSLAIGGGHATWTRSSASLGSSVTRRRGSLGVQAHGDVLGALLAISGQDLPAVEKGTQAALGVAVGARGLIGFEGGDLWLDVTVTTWPGRHQVLLRGAAQQADLPAAELIAGVGVDFFVWP